MVTEKRLIDVNKVINSMQKCLDESPDQECTVAYFTFASIIVALKQEPTVDAVEVVHGRWIPSHSKCDCTCSVCNTEFDNILNDALEDWNYCPNCGAMMDGGTDNGL